MPSLPKHKKKPKEKGNYQKNDQNQTLQKCT